MLNPQPAINDRLLSNTSAVVPYLSRALFMESSELFSHPEQQEPMPDAEGPMEPPSELVFSDQPSDRPMPRADAQSS